MCTYINSVRSCIFKNTNNCYFFLFHSFHQEDHHCVSDFSHSDFSSPPSYDCATDSGGTCGGFDWSQKDKHLNICPCLKRSLSQAFQMLPMLGWVLILQCFGLQCPERVNISQGAIYVFCVTIVYFYIYYLSSRLHDMWSSEAVMCSLLIHCRTTSGETSLSTFFYLLDKAAKNAIFWILVKFWEWCSKSPYFTRNHHKN